jgi:Cu-Zn family superoxide dismutase
MRIFTSRPSRLAVLAGAIATTSVLATTAPAMARGGPERATATIEDATGQTIGSARLTEHRDGGTRVRVHVKGLAPGEHGIHIHAVGACDGPAFTTAGPHFNPDGRQHGLDNPLGAHAGDLPDLVVNEAGVGRLRAVTDAVTISSGPRSLLDGDGSAIVVHAAPDDDVTDPTGNSGARVACGVIAAR